jgi:hypothetical protein
MAINTSEIQVGAAAIATDIDHMTLHTAQPDATGSNQTSAAAQAVTPTSTGGVVSIGSTAFTGGAASGACTHVGFWHGDPATTGTFRGWLALTGDQTFNASGAYTVDSVTLTGSAT